MERDCAWVMAATEKTKAARVCWIAFVDMDRFYERNDDFGIANITGVDRGQSGNVHAVLLRLAEDRRRFVIQHVAKLLAEVKQLEFASLLPGEAYSRTNVPSPILST